MENTKLSYEELMKLYLSEKQKNEENTEAIEALENINDNKAKQIKLLESINDTKEKEIKKLETKNEKQEKAMRLLQRKNDKLELKVCELNQKIEKLIKKYEAKIEESNLNKAKMFGKKSEKLEDEATNEHIVKRAKAGRKRQSESFLEELKDLATITTEVKPDFEALGVKEDELKRFGEDVSYKIHLRKVKYEVEKVIRPKYRDKENIYQALSDDMFPHSPLTPSLAANIITMKFDLQVPLDRYSHHLIASGLRISTQNLSNYVSRTVEILKPVYEQMKKDLVNNKAKVIHADETTLNVIGSKERQKDYMFLYATSFFDNTIYVYSFNGSRGMVKTKELLKDFKGYLVCDGYAGYNTLKEQGIKLQKCHVHLRRYFYDCFKGQSEENQIAHPAYKIVKLIDELSKSDNEIKKTANSIKEIKEKRNEKAYLEKVENLKKAINNLEVDDDSLLARAKNYYLGMEPDLFTYLENGYVDNNNNLAERAIRPFTIGRKNWLFAKTTEGASELAILYSIIHTAKENALRVEEYIEYLITNIGKVDIAKLVPYSNDIPKRIKLDLKKD